MKTLLVFALMFFTIHVHAQKKEFLRIYNYEGKKIIRGSKYLITDSTIVFNKKNKIISYSQVGFIKTKHSFGHNIWVGSLIGFATTGLIALLLPYDKYKNAFDRGTTVGLVATFIGAPGGAVIGAGSTIFEKSKKFEINGNLEKWKEFEYFMLKKSK